MMEVIGCLHGTRREECGVCIKSDGEWQRETEMVTLAMEGFWGGC